MVLLVQCHFDLGVVDADLSAVASIEPCGLCRDHNHPLVFYRTTWTIGYWCALQSHLLFQFTSLGLLLLKPFVDNRFFFWCLKLQCLMSTCLLSALLEQPLLIDSV